MAAARQLPTRVVVADNVVQSCLAHALTTEGEEIIGFCLGGCSDQTAFVWETCVRPRSDKRSDRCEVAPEDQFAATEEAEKLTQAGLTTKVVGWYHSHPHITCPPSHVDLRTQGHLQALGLGVALIFSVFNNASEPRDGFTSSQELGRIQVHCFQTGPGNTAVSVPVHVVPQCVAVEMALGQPVPLGCLAPSGFEKAGQVLRTMVDEERMAHEKQQGHDSAAFHAAMVYCKTLSNIDAGYLTPLTVQLEREATLADDGVTETDLEEARKELERVQGLLMAARGVVETKEAERTRLLHVYRQAEEILQSQDVQHVHEQQQLMQAHQAQQIQNALAVNAF
eukprot:TRINITY_DN6516_c0_g7_i1.p1 TRINITY_DN6516_c0_g7~~TRINITY_DN6516_c0_g7_i1.p1  ORF type:complete len:338 (+),score=98.59 TRINITY_DN6516_c0_g7_i1:79-1092(+)